jgi:hypothetical protein
MCLLSVRADARLVVRARDGLVYRWEHDSPAGWALWKLGAERTHSSSNVAALCPQRLLALVATGARAANNAASGELAANQLIRQQANTAPPPPVAPLHNNSCPCLSGSAGNLICGTTSPWAGPAPARGYHRYFAGNVVVAPGNLSIPPFARPLNPCMRRLALQGLPSRRWESCWRHLCKGASYRPGGRSGFRFLWKLLTSSKSSSRGDLVAPSPLCFLEFSPGPSGKARPGSRRRRMSCEQGE